MECFAGSPLPRGGKVASVASQPPSRIGTASPHGIKQGI